MKAKKLKAPFPYFGGKSTIADEVWRRFGDADNYIEPFAGTLAVLLRRPGGHKRRIETVNDWNCYLANFWRAVKRDPETVAVHADWPVSEIDLHARHRWLVLSAEAAEFRQQMRTDPEYFDAKIAGWWVWGQCCWIGSGWCDEPDWDSTRPALNKILGSGVNEKRPQLSGDHPGTGPGKGVNGTGPDRISNPKRRPVLSQNGHGMLVSPSNQIPNLSGDAGATGRGVHASAMTAGRPQLADAFARGRGVHGHDDAGTCQQRLDWLIGWFNLLADRFRVVRVCCGDWLRVCDSSSVTTRLGDTAVFLDPPYRTKLADGSENRDGSIYASDKAACPNELVDGVQAYCLERGSDPKMRIAVCGLEGEGYEALEAVGWDCWHWKSAGGYANRSGTDKRENRKRERIWFSPHCLRGDASLFE